VREKTIEYEGKPREGEKERERGREGERGGGVHRKGGKKHHIYFSFSLSLSPTL